MQVFFLNQVVGMRGTLAGDEARHCSKVLRHQVGDHIHGIDGKGKKFLGEIMSIAKDRVILSLSEQKHEWGEQPTYIRLGVSPLRLKDRFEWLIEKAVELGVHEIVPIICKRTYKYSGKWKSYRLATIILSAVKQSKRSRIPTFPSPTLFEDFIQSDSSSLRLMGYCEADSPIQAGRELIQQAESISLLIGPEGDFSPEEVALAGKAGFKPLSFGENRLRTETAATFAMSTIKLIKGY